MHFLAATGSRFWLVWILLCAGCAGDPGPWLEDQNSGERIQNIQSLSISGRRDGDRLPATITVQLPASTLKLDLVFRIGVPTTLVTGTYSWPRSDASLAGPVRGRSLTFLGGQSDHPNLGGNFELLSRQGNPLYTLRVPTSEVLPPRP